MEHQKRILVLNTGGTLSSIAKEHGLSPGISAEQMERELHVVAGETILDMEDFASLDSANIFPEDWALLAQRISEAREAYDGIVVIHGTDTLAYTSSMLSFMLRNIRIPVVITGSQLSISNPVADAMENLRCAIYMAGTGCPGVYVAFNRKVILGCRASKVRSVSFNAFDSINYPNVAEISSLGMNIHRETIPTRNGIFRLQKEYCDQVATLKLFPGMHRNLLTSLAKEGCKAIYMEAYGLGGLPFRKHDFVETVRELVADGMIILVGTQCRYEGSNLTVYETGHRALEAGVLQACDMTAEAAITKLMWVLGQTQNPEEIREYFSLNLCGEVTLPSSGQ